jgi:uncharacterized SAM-binding protein YcdF (DUF218 family)
VNEIDIDRNARVVWTYHLMGHLPVKSDAILVLGSHDSRVAERGAQLYLQGWAPLLVCSGGRGRLTAGWELTEAEVFARVAVRHGVPPNRILVEDHSTNTSENLLFTRRMMEGQGIRLESAILVQKPYMERRTWCTCRKVWPELRIVVTSPQISFESYPNQDIVREDMIHIMVGDLQRLRVYAERGYQIAQEIPEEVWEAWKQLVQAGYTRHLVE